MKAPTFSSRERYALSILVIITIISRLALVLRPEWRIATRPYLDDVFYIFTVSSHLASGHGLTIDGAHTTNGIQPLITFLYAPFFYIAGADKLLALRLCTIVSAVCDSLSVVFLALLIRRITKKNTDSQETPLWLRPPIIAAALWTFLYPIMTHTLTGLETGLYSALLVIGLYIYVSLERIDGRIPIRQTITIGIVLGLTVLARIDGAIFVAAIAATEIYRYRSNGIRNAIALCVIAFVISSPWWIYNVTTFGSIMPLSGQAEALEKNIFTYNLESAAIAIGDIFTVFFFLPNYHVPVWFHYVWLAATSTIIFFIGKTFLLRAYLRERYHLAALLPLALAGVVLMIYYVCFFAAPHFIARYSQLLRIFWLIVAACSFPQLFKVIGDRYKRNRRVVTFGIVVFALCAVGFSASRYVYYFVLPDSSEFYLTSQWATQHSNEWIGMNQSGTAGFFSPNVVNLDGKVNADALHALQHDDIGEYIARRNLDYIVDWDEFASTDAASAARHGAYFERVDTIGKRMIVYKRIR